MKSREGSVASQALTLGSPVAFHAMTKPIGPICNLDCSYCFYLEKEGILTRNAPGQPAWQMADDILESYIRQYIEQQDVPEISFAWQGGEPTLLGVRFFQRVVELQNKHASGKTIQNALQTNGTLLTDAWGEFLRENQFLVGLSIDGPRELHDVYRVDKQGAPTFDRVMQGLQVLKKHGVEFNTLTVVNRRNGDYPLEVYRFLKQIGSQYHQFIPLVERELPQSAAEGGLIKVSLAPPPRREIADLASPVTAWSVGSEQYGRFLTTIFDEWVRRDVGRTFVQAFDVALGIWAGAGYALCVFAPTCGSALALEHNGDLYSCDHFVYPEYFLGNIQNQTIRGMVTGEQQRKFGMDKRDSLPQYCKSCDVKFACNGECPKHRFLLTPDGEPGLNYLCAGYKHFFSHIKPYMETMTRLLNSHRAPAEIMTMLNTPARREAGRNELCPCGSGRKYKHCCLRNRQL